MQWMVPERRLDEHQLDILRKCGGLRGRNQWIQGFAGSGKTILIVHAVQRVLAVEPGAKICIAVFTHALKDLIRSGLPEKYASKVPVITYHQLLREGRRYDLLYLDEVQDIPSADLQRIRAFAGRVVVAGDTDQSIYDRCSTPDEITAALQPDEHRLQVVYRLTKRVIDIVKTILPNSLVESVRSAGRMKNVEVTLAQADTETAEIEWLWDHCRRYSKQGEPYAILLPNHALIQAFMKQVARLESAPVPQFPQRAERSGSTDYRSANAMLRRQGIPLQYLGNDYGSLVESDTRPLTYVLTYHSAKGLDFETVFLPHLNSDQMFWHRDPDIDRRLFFVGATRSRTNLFLSYFSHEPHPYVQAMPLHLLHQEKCEVRRNQESEDEFFF